jgi:hypothetical protein
MAASRGRSVENIRDFCIPGWLSELFLKGPRSFLGCPTGLSKKRPLGARQEATCANDIYSFEAIIGVNLFHDAANMILHCEFG